ncbi:hypothetical protein DVH05_021476 [Phytophthora capsici]|nr:hypothetical protein DVH05_021476 [Phytophthora capsici]
MERGAIDMLTVIPVDQVVPVGSVRASGGKRVKHWNVTIRRDVVAHDHDTLVKRNRGAPKGTVDEEGGLSVTEKLKKWWVSPPDDTVQVIAFTIAGVELKEIQRRSCNQR